MLEHQQRIVGIIRSDGAGITQLVTKEDGQSVYEAFTIVRPREEPKDIVNNRRQPATSRKYNGGRG